MQCNVCSSPLGEPIFDAGSEQALTSLCELRKARVRVWSCPTCAHLLGDALPDTEAYYASDYRILINHDDEDQIYEVQEDRIVYRTEHQVATLLDKLRLPDGALLLDYGCAKASTPHQLLKQRADLKVHLFDVSHMYEAYWDRFIPQTRRAVHETPSAWQARFDAVTSFFSLEHIPKPQEALVHIAALLKEDGCFYGIVPDTFGNVADFVVIDHVSHFTVPSLHRLLSSAGFRYIEIDAHAHRGALVFLARKQGSVAPSPERSEVLQRSRALARYWGTLGERLRNAERNNRGSPAAIYGSGFYGAYIASALTDLECVQCFLDRSPFRQGKSMFGKPILAADPWPAGIETLYIGLNPAIARAALNPFPSPGIKPIFLEPYTA